MKVKLICQQCGKEFERDSWDVKRGRTRFCGYDCYHKAQVGVLRPYLLKREIVKCRACGKEFERGGRLGNRTYSLCSIECQQASRYRHGAVANVLSEHDAAYLAGFVDGEGSIMLTPRRDKCAVKLAVVNTHKGVMDWIAEKTGISVVLMHGKKSKHSKQGYMWLINGDAADSVIKQLLPHLIVKRAQADLAIETQERLRDPALNADRSWQKEYIVRMKTLNARANSKYYQAGG